MHRVLEWFTDRLVSLASLFLLIMMLHVCADVALKYLMNRPIEGTLEIVSYYYMVAAVFLPLAFVELTRSAVAVDLFFIMMPRAMKITCMGLVLLICMVTYAGLAWITWHDALRALARREVVMGSAAVPIWPSRFVLPISFALGSLVCLWHFGRLVFSPRARADLVALGAPEEGAL